jgi:hypothetical protein
MRSKGGGGQHQHLAGLHVFVTCAGAQKNQNVTVEQQRSLI